MCPLELPDKLKVRDVAVISPGPDLVALLCRTLSSRPGTATAIRTAEIVPHVSLFSGH